jgi:hypothetical protein
MGDAGIDAATATRRGLAGAERLPEVIERLDP